ncbi:hypothetical protein ACUXSK_001071 [Staphylococcus warneri]
MDLIGKIIAFIMTTISNLLGSSDLFRDIKSGLKSLKD